MWKEIAEKTQFDLNDLLGSRCWDEINKNDLFLLKRKIGFATCGNPKEMPTSNNYFTGYSVENLEMIKVISNQIISISDHDPILFACTFLILFWDNEISTTPVFRIVNKNGNIFVDINGRVYNDWESFINENQLPKCSYCCPLNGEYISENTLELQFNESPACRLINKAVDYIDTTATVISIGATLGSLALFTPVLVPVIGVASIYHACRSAATLHGRNSHQQSIGLNDRESRNAWLNIAGSAVGFGTAAAISKAKQVVESGKQLSKLTVFGMNVLNGSSLLFNGFGFVDNLILCQEKYMRGTLTPLDVFHLSCEVLFFYNAIASVKATSKMLNQISEVNMTKGSTEKLKLSKTQKRNLRRKINKQKAKLSKLNINDENSSDSTCDRFLTGLAGGILYKIMKGFVPNVEGMLYRYQSIGHVINSWINKEINIECLMKSLWNQLLNLSKEIVEDVNYIFKVIQNLRLKVKEYFQSASHNQQIQFCFSVQNLENRIETYIGQINEEVEELKDSNTNEEDAIRNTSSFEENNEESIEQDQTDDEKTSPEVQDLLEKTEEIIVSHFNCDNLEDYQCIVESVETVLLDDFLDKFNQYKNSVNAAKLASSGFNLDLFNSAYGIEGDPGQYFFNQALISVDRKKLIRKIKDVHEKNRNEKSQNTNILEGKGAMYSFSVPNHKGEMTKEEILCMIVNKMKLKDVEEKNIIFESIEERNCTVLFIRPKDDSGIEIKGIAVFYETNEENTTCGFFNLYQ